ncbi:hypothetical protein ACIQ9R_37620 [Streptomyces sp. NPDC094447]|uniref:hypothetical protein n=1 Tax=Streptomyces sp. NPDC094447 TaxID=3366062 RepID=UPI0038128DB0
MLLMTRKKAATEYHRRARIRVRTSFDGFRQGDTAEVHIDPVVAGWIEVGVVEIVEELGGPDGKDPAGPGGAEQDVLGDEQA